MTKANTKAGNVAKAAVVGALVMTVGANAALAGGFAVREQSALGQGSSFAGAGASQALSSMFWNSAAVTVLGGTNTDANIAAILPEGELTAKAGSTWFGNPAFNQSTDIGVNAYVPASYINHQLKGYDPKVFIGLGVNSAFGLKTEPDKRWAGSEVGSATSLFTVNFNPTVGYKFSEQFAIGIGAQLEYAKGTFKFATGLPTGPHTFFTGDDLAVGATAGVTFTPSSATTISLGWRSQITHELEGRFATGAGAPFTAGQSALLGPGVASKVELRLPDIVTLGLNQAISPSMRVMGTVEWTNWSRFGGLEVVAQDTGRTIVPAPFGVVTPGQSIARIDAPWSDGWYFSAGAEYDVSPALTVRAGGAYEISPIKNATDRIIGIPDADRIWASVGFSYKVTQNATIDFGYSHVFVEEAGVDRLNVAGNRRIVADLDASADIFSFGLRMPLGGH
jgi:long-chain fatty acid transport protein